MSHLVLSHVLYLSFFIFPLWERGAIVMLQLYSFISQLLTLYGILSMRLELGYLDCANFDKLSVGEGSHSIQHGTKHT